jgi:phosphosulfolactate phosphohydrolase-like enzyme
MPRALGAKRLLLVESLAAALDLAERRPDSLTMKEGRPDPRFDLVNSPASSGG